jgi:hypothetical protein
MSEDGLRAAGWFVGATVDELMEAILAAGDEVDRDGAEG